MPVVETKGSASSQGFGEFAKSGGAANYIEDVFSTYLYTGNGTTQTITNGIDLSTKGGLVWCKNRASNLSGSEAHEWYDTVRGAGYAIFSNATSAQQNYGSSRGVTAFSTTGFTVTNSSTYIGPNADGITEVGWTFRKQAKFFDIVTYTGDGVAGRTVAHNLGSTPGCIIVKCTSTTSNWGVYHRGANNGVNPQNYRFLLNGANGEASDDFWNNTAPTSTVFTVGSNAVVNSNGETYVAYVFAHNAGGFGLAGTDNVISCGVFSADSSGNATVNLGYEPQLLLFKIADSAGSWYLADNMRNGLLATGASSYKALYPNNANAEAGSYSMVPSATGFSMVGGDWNRFIYIAIRRGPMKTPTSGTSVFTPLTFTGDGTVNRPLTAGFPADVGIPKVRINTGFSGGNSWLVDRLRGKTLMVNGTFDESTLNAYNILSFTQQQNAVTTGSSTSFINSSGDSQIIWMYRRAPGFMDVVCYTGNGANQTLPHNLGSVPQLMITKNRTNASNWRVYDAFNGATKRGSLNDAQPWDVQASQWNDTAPTATQFTVGTSNSASGSNYVIYLFASCPGVSKVGSYTGTGTTKQIDCGFTGGARFVLIKRTDDIGDWYVWDSARGIVAGNDPYLLLNSSNAEVTNTDYVDTYSAGFEISSTAPAEINANGGTFIFLAIA